MKRTTNYLLYALIFIVAFYLGVAFTAGITAAAQTELPCGPTLVDSGTEITAIAFTMTPTPMNPPPLPTNWPYTPTDTPTPILCVGKYCPPPVTPFDTNTPEGDKRRK